MLLVCRANERCIALAALLGFIADQRQVDPQRLLSAYDGSGQIHMKAAFSTGTDVIHRDKGKIYYFEMLHSLY